ncbi:MAG: XRE family transcriptional regulator, partial [Ferruginibacter sp.]|nr:XRE family transcriptional regulator [Ferruginibacter sp.]
IFGRLSQQNKMESIGENIKRLRITKKITLAHAAKALNIEETILTEIENGKKKVSPAEIVIIENYYKTLSSFNCNNEFEDRKEINKSLTLGEDVVIYSKTAISKRTENIIKDIKDFLHADKRTSAAYLFGSYARGEEKPESDIDIMVEFNTNKNYSFFDLLDIAFFLEKKLKIKVDIVEKGFIHDFALQNAVKDIIKIYG